MQLKLISFDRCPFVQRSVITLLYQGTDFEIEYIDLADKPAWFLEVSPLGRVPALVVDEGGKKTALFESAVINEYLAEVTAAAGKPYLLPDDALERAKCRAWIEFSSTLFTANYHLSYTKEKSVFEAEHAKLQDKLVQLESAIAPAPFFCGSAFSLVDAAFAPFFMRCELWRDVFESYRKDDFPKISAWSDALLALPAVQDSVRADLKSVLREKAQEGETYLGTLLAA